MSDVLGYLNEVTHRVAATFMPTEMEDVASFLRGDAWVLVTAPHPSATETSTAPTDTTATASSSSSPPAVRTPAALRYPLGATSWGRYIPLGIAGAALISAATAGSRAALLNFFESSGFSQVFSVSLVATEQQSHDPLSTGNAGSNSGSGVGGGGAPMASPIADLASLSSSAEIFQAGSRKRARSHTGGPAKLSGAAVINVAMDSRGGAGTSAQASQQACVAAVRQWFEELEARLRDDQQQQCNIVNDSGTRQGALPGVQGGSERGKTELQRLLVLVHCSAETRFAMSTRSNGGLGGHHHHHSFAGVPLSTSSFSSPRRPRHGADPLLSFLHDFAALTTLYEARLAFSPCQVRPAVLLLPEDEGYGGALLRQQLKDEVGYRYWVHLFLQSDHAPQQGGRETGSYGAPMNAGGVRRDGWTAALMGHDAAQGRAASQRWQRTTPTETPLRRGCRLADFWGVLDSSVLTSSSSPLGSPHAADMSIDARAEWRYAEASAEKLEEALRRHPACFFVRPSNFPFCVFVMEALRRFPLLAPPVMLRHWQSCWTARHALSDVVMVVHSAVCPFTVSAANAAPSRSTEAARRSPGRPHANSPFASVEENSENVFAASARLQDTTDLLDALLDAAFTLAEDRDGVQPLTANEFCVEQSILFCLLYDALVHQREGRLRRIPAVVDVLVRLYDRHAKQSDNRTSEESETCTTDGGGDAAAPSIDEKVRFAVRHLLPFCPLNTFYAAVDHHTRSSGATTATKYAGGAAAGKSIVAHRSAVERREVLSYPMNTLVLPMRRLSVVPQLQHTTLLALLPPDASLTELRGVAETTYAEQLPACWRRVVEAVSRSGVSAATRSAPRMTSNLKEGVSASATEKVVDAVHALGALQGDQISCLPVQLSAENFYHPLVPHAVRVLYLLTAHALYAPTEVAKQVPVVQLQMVCQLSDEELLRALKELQMAGLINANFKTQTARTLLDSI